MSVIAFDLTTIAADCQATCADMRRHTVKLVRGADKSVVFGWTGTDALGRMLMEWYENGRVRAAWPAAQATPDWNRLIVARKGYVEEFEQHPLPAVHRAFTAWGSGRDFAMGALAMGASARHAVVIASRYSIGCGMGVTVKRLCR